MLFYAATRYDNALFVAWQLSDPAMLVRYLTDQVRIML